MNAWVEIEGPASARAYLRSVLAAGLGLSAWLCERYRVEHGALHVLVPEGMRLPEEVNFRESLAPYAMGTGTRPPLRSEAKHRDRASRFDARGQQWGVSRRRGPVRAAR